MRIDKVRRCSTTNDVEKELNAMILARRARGFRASPTWLTHNAEWLMRERHPDLADFEGGREWRRRFLARHRLTWCANVDQTDDHKVPPNNLFVGPVHHMVPPNKTDQLQPVDRGVGGTVKRFYMAKLLDEQSC